MMYRQGGLSATYEPTQSQVQIGTSGGFGVNFLSSILWSPITLGGPEAYIFDVGSRTPLAQMQGGILITDVSPGANPNIPGFKITYDTQVQTYDFDTRVIGSPMNHRECSFVAPRWCGDGIISNGEVCDAGAANGTPGSCNATCSGTAPVIASCDSLTAVPSSGTAPHTVNLSCNATNASSYKIDCGNGFTNLSSTATCVYRDGGTFTPTCTINGSMTSPACTSTVTVNPPPATPLCSSTITGTQTSPLFSTTPGICAI